jgi:hypothetical protein
MHLKKIKKLKKVSRLAFSSTAIFDVGLGWVPLCESQHHTNVLGLSAASTTPTPPSAFFAFLVADAPEGQLPHF